MDPQKPPGQPITIGRYVLFGDIASGGMATVHFGRLLGEAGFSRTVAIKRMHPHCASDPEFTAMFLDEARLVARIRHPNVVPVLDVVRADGELSLVMEYVEGETLSRLLSASRHAMRRPPDRVVAAILTNVLEGLHSAHEAVSEQGEPLGIVHRDVSPQNVMVGLDGVARVLDFGIAKASVRLQSTRRGQLKGKIAYMAPEQLRDCPVDRRTDVWAVGVVLWEALTGRRLFDGDNEAALLLKVVEAAVEPPSSIEGEISPPLDDVVMRALRPDPADRFQTAQEMSVALEHCVGLATPREVGRWVQELARERLLLRAQKISEIESASSSFTHLELEGQASAPAAPLAVPEPEAARAALQEDAADNPPDVSSFRRNRGAPLLAVGAAGALLIAGALWWFLRESPVTPSAAAGHSASVGEPAASSPTSPSVSASSSPDAIASAPLPKGSAASKRSGPARSVSQPMAASAPGSARPPPAKGADCSPPYTLDSEGVKVPKPHCF